MNETVVGEPIQFPNLPIPFGRQVVILALSDNTGTVYVASGKATVLEHGNAFPLRKGQGIGYQIENLSKLWLDVDNNGDGIAWTIEEEN